jgi:hypothetical protein
MGRWKIGDGRWGKSAPSVLIVAGLICRAFTGAATAADINKGYTFSAGEHNVTHTKLNNLVDLATINYTFVTDKSVAAPASGDSFLFYSSSAGGLRRCTFDTLLLSNTNLISGQNELTTPATNDYVLVQTAAGLLDKSTLNSLVFTNTALINNRTNWATPSWTSTYLLAYDSGNWSKLSRSNLFYGFEGFLSFTNLASRTTPSASDQVLLWTGSTNTTTTLGGLVTNSTVPSAVSAGDYLWGYSTNTNNVVKFTLAQVRGYVTNAATDPNNVVAFTNQLPRYKMVVSNLVVSTSDVVYTNAHGLPGIPQLVRCVLVCTNAELGYAAGDEIGIEGSALGAAAAPVACPSADTSNIYLACNLSGSTVTVCTKTSGVQGTITKSKWNFKVYATYFP